MQRASYYFSKKTKRGNLSFFEQAKSQRKHVIVGITVLRWLFVIRFEKR